MTGLIRPPSSTTIRLVLAAADGDALDRALGRFLQERRHPVSGRRAIAVDGKTLRGSRTKDWPATALIAMVTHSGQVLAQRQVDSKNNELPALPDATTGSELAAWIRGHWRIENQPHHVRDRTFREDVPKSAPGTCLASWPVCATSPPASTARSATPASPPHSATPAPTTSDLTALGLT